MIARCGRLNLSQLQDKFPHTPILDIRISASDEGGCAGSRIADATEYRA